MEKIAKIFSIGIITLFIGISIAPLTGSIPIVNISKNLEKKISIPVTITHYHTNGQVTTEIKQLAVNAIPTLEDIGTKLQSKTSVKETIDLLELYIPFFEDIEVILNFQEPVQLSDSIIVSIGKEKHLIPPLLPKIRSEKLFHIWHYSSDWSTTLFYEDQLSLSPTEILQGEQIGFMLGFKGIYLYIPKWVPGFEDMGIILGTTTFAWGISLV